MSNDTPFDALDTRLVFKVYAVVAWTTGGLLYGWGGLVFRAPMVVGVPYSYSMMVRLVGAVVLGVGFLAIAMARTKDNDARRRALGWWAVAHAVVLAGIGLQFWALIGLENLGWSGLAVLGSLFGSAVLFTHFWQTADGIPWGGLQSHDSVLEEIRRPTIRHLRSTYEDQIREAAGQEERHRLARDLHDSIKQQIFVIHTAAATAQARFDSDPAGTKAAIDQVRTSAREAMAEMEAMLDQLRASPLENNGLVEALKKQCEALRFRTGADVRVTIGELPPSESLTPGAQQAIFRVAQEALANVGRHARAKHVTVTLDSTPISVRLSVDDDGLGFDTAQSDRGMGLGNMRSRVEALGGALALTSEPGKGTLVRTSVPHEPQPSAADVAAYRRRAIFYGAFSLLWLGGLPLWMLDRDRVDLAMWSVFMVFNCTITARATIGYRRARRSISGAAEGAGTA
jgi:signal transduction histidine kinase